MIVKEIEEKLRSYKREVQEFHPFLKNFLVNIPNIKHVEYTHGNREYGADFILIEENQMLLKESYIGVIVKVGKITQADVDVIERQINEGFRIPKVIFNGGREINLNKLWVLTNGNITTNARDKIGVYFKQINVEIIDLQMLSRLVVQHYSQYLTDFVDNVFTIRNHHVEDSGKIPVLETDGKYKGYYENIFGEQFIFLGDRKSKTGIIRGGDFGWETTIEVYAGMRGGKWVFGNEEIFWISHCYSTMLNVDFEEVLNEFLVKLNPFNKLSNKNNH